MPRWLAALGAALMLLAACAGQPAPTPTSAAPAAASGAFPVVAAESLWGSIAQQLGGDRGSVSSIIADPNADPHDYEPTPADARRFASARLVIVNGAGYDAWATKLLAANPTPGREVLDVGKLVGRQPGANPHLWYEPDVIERVVDRLTALYSALAPADAGYFSQQHRAFLAALRPYDDLLSSIKNRYQGVAIGATEDLFSGMAQFLGLDLISPPAFMRAMAEGGEPAPIDRARFDAQIDQKRIAVLVWNTQTQTPDTAALVQRARQAGVPVVPVTETLSPSTATFQAWQVRQLQALEQALAQATGR